jgi:hypothetical protein
MVRDEALTQAKDRLDHWLAALNAYDVQYVILDTERDGELLRTVQSNPRWTVDFQEGTSILFARTRVHVGARVAV